MFARVEEQCVCKSRRAVCLQEVKSSVFAWLCEQQVVDSPEDRPIKPGLQGRKTFEQLLEEQLASEEKRVSVSLCVSCVSLCVLCVSQGWGGGGNALRP